MMKGSFVLSVLYLCLSVSLIAADPTTFTASGNLLLNNGQPFLVKGICYDPSPIGFTPAPPAYAKSPVSGDFTTNEFRETHERDISIIRQMGANTIRLYADWGNMEDHTSFLDLAWNNGTDPLYVMPTFWLAGYVYQQGFLEVSTLNYTITKAIEMFTGMLTKYKDHPAVMMWLLGNELDGNSVFIDAQHQLAMYTLVNALSAAAAKIDPAHPCSSPIAMDPDAVVGGYTSGWDVIKGNFPSGSNPDALKDLGVWAIQVYAGSGDNYPPGPSDTCSFSKSGWGWGDIFQYYQSLGVNNNRPLIITEFGMDAFDNTAMQEWEGYQAQCLSDLWKEIEDAFNKKLVAGAVVFAFADGWWKGQQGEYPTTYANQCPELNAYFQSTCGYYKPNNGFPDKAFNEEYWGINKYVVTAGADCVMPRKAVYALNDLWDGTFQPSDNETFCVSFPTYWNQQSASDVTVRPFKQPQQHGTNKINNWF